MSDLDPQTLREEYKRGRLDAAREIVKRLTGMIDLNTDWEEDLAVIEREFCTPQIPPFDDARAEQIARGEQATIYKVTCGHCGHMHPIKSDEASAIRAEAFAEGEAKGRLAGLEESAAWLDDVQEFQETMPAIVPNIGWQYRAHFLPAPKEREAHWYQDKTGEVFCAIGSPEPGETLTYLGVTRGVPVKE